MRLMSERARAATEQQIFMCLMCHKCLAVSITEMNEETAVQPVIGCGIEGLGDGKSHSQSVIDNSPRIPEMRCFAEAASNTRGGPMLTYLNL